MAEEAAIGEVGTEIVCAAEDEGGVWDEEKKLASEGDDLFALVGTHDVEEERLVGLR